MVHTQRYKIAPGIFEKCFMENKDKRTQSTQQTNNPNLINQLWKRENTMQGSSTMKLHVNTQSKTY